MGTTLILAEVNGCALLHNLIFIAQCNTTFNLTTIFRIRIGPNEGIVVEVFIANTRITWIGFWVEFIALEHRQSPVVAFMKRGFVFVTILTGRAAHIWCVAACTVWLKWKSAQVFWAVNVGADEFSWSRLTETKHNKNVWTTMLWLRFLYDLLLLGTSAHAWRWTTNTINVWTYFVWFAIVMAFAWI